MLEKVIKRDGSIENFIPHKLNYWGKWAAEYLPNKNIDWSSLVLDTVKNLNGTIHTQDLQKYLIKNCLMQKTSPYNIMAGRLYIALIKKEIYNNNVPKVKELHDKLFDLGYMVKLNYTDEEYDEIENIINHDKDYTYAHFQIHQIYKKYSIQNRVTRESYEIPQFTFMRMAMALANDEPNKMQQVKDYYNLFSSGILSAPTPNYKNLGTNHRGYASCCIFTVSDTYQSIGAGHDIAYTMTTMSAGIGCNLIVRSLGDPVRNGSIEHQGKMPYYRSLAGIIKCNLQAGRSGACTVSFSCFDPEAIAITMLQNPMTPKDKQNRDLHFCVLLNRFFARKVAKNEDVFQFNCYTAPELDKAFYSGDQDEFERIYNQYEQDDNFKKEYISARKLMLYFGQQSYDVGTFYYTFIDEVNRHTPFKETIYSSNLCNEIMEPTKPYLAVKDLYSEDENIESEIALCNLAAINIAAVSNDNEYSKAMYYALKMIDKTIHDTDYKIKHLGVTAKKRLNAGVGIIGLAHHLAKKGLKYTTQEGLNEIHRVAERHCYHAISSSLRLGKELGNAPWIHKTKWPDGWLPIDTYKKTVDSIVEPVYNYDWENLRSRIIENGGIRNSCLVSHMPTESSSKALNSPNSVYPIRNLFVKKTDLTNTIDWCAPDNDVLQNEYEIAWSIPSSDLIKVYAVIQKFTDQGISADLYKDRSKNAEISSKEIIQEFLDMIKYGMKSRYYQNSYVVSDVHKQTNETIVNKNVCEGVCTL